VVNTQIFLPAWSPNILVIDSIMTALVTSYTLFAIKLMLPGLLLVALNKPRTGSWSGLTRAAAVLVYGLIANLIAVVVLGPLGWWTPAADLTVWVAIVAVSSCLAIVNQGSLWPEVKKNAIPGAAVFLIGFLAACMPVRSEWLAGGWDPGMYVNNAIAIANRSGIVEREPSLYASLNEDERLLLSSSEGRYRELFPSVPIDVVTGSIPLYHFHLTPMMGAMLYRAGGYELLFRMPVLLAFWGVPVFLALCRAVGVTRPGLWACGFFWCLNPVWWYQQAVPTSEMLYVFLMLGGVFLYLEAMRSEVRIPLAAMLAMIAATMNHLNFILVGGIIVASLALVESRTLSPTSRARVLSCLVALGLGLLLNLGFAGVTIDRLEEKDRALTLLLIALAASVFFAGLVICLPKRFHSKLSPIIERLPAWILYLTGASGLTFSLFCLHPRLLQICFKVAEGTFVRDVLYHGQALIAFCGVGTAVLASLGLIIMARSVSAKPSGASVIIAVSLIIFGIFMASPGVFPTYPWALRRFAPWLFLVMALSQAVVVQATFSGSWVRKGFFLGFLMWGIWSGANQSHASAGVSDYRGLKTALSDLAGKLIAEDLIVADDPRYGTPLFMIFGQDVINGRQIWSSKDPDARKSIMDVLNRLANARNGRVLWLTTDEDGLRLYPESPAVYSNPVFSLDFEYDRILHHTKMRRFMTEKRSDILRVYEQKTEKTQ
jgi:hypothetical protein